MKSKTNNIKSRFRFPATLTPDLDDGGFVVTFRDIPEAITQGDSIEEALEEAADCLEEAIAGRIDDEMAIPYPSDIKPENEYLVYVPLQTAMKAAIVLALQESNTSKVELAHELNVAPREVRRILDPHHDTKVRRMEKTLKVLGKEPTLSI